MSCLQHRFIACLVGLTACGSPPRSQLAGDGGGIGDAVSDALLEVGFPAPHPSAPRIEDVGGGSVLRAPQLTSVYFANDDSAVTATLDAFTTKLVKSSWAGAAAEYGVGAMTATPSIKLSEVAPPVVDLAAVGTFVAAKLDANDPRWPAAGPDTLFIIYYPSGVTITAAGQQSCTAFGGLHSSTTLDAGHGLREVAYVVVPRCATFKGLSGIDAATAAVSGKVIAAVSDPYPGVTPAFGQYDAADLVWDRVMGGGEVDAECGLESSAFQTFSDLPFIVQRFWSNRSAAAGHAFCAPAPADEVYFNSAAVLPDTVTIAGVTMSAVRIAAGESKTIEVDLYSDAPTSGPWSVTAFDHKMLSLGGAPDLMLSVDRATGHNGEKINLTIKVLSANANGSAFLLQSTLGTVTHLWAGLVTQ